MVCFLFCNTTSFQTWRKRTATPFIIVSFQQIKPLVKPTKDIMDINKVEFLWHELFPHGIHPSFVCLLWKSTFVIFCWRFLVNTAKNNYGAVASLWAPVIMVFYSLLGASGPLLTIFHFCISMFSVLYAIILQMPCPLCKISGLFYGYSNLVRYIYHNLWWFHRSIWPSWRGNFCEHHPLFSAGGWG